MAVNLDKPGRWKNDIALSVDMFNSWFMKFAPTAFRETRVQATDDVASALKATSNLMQLDPQLMRKSPAILATLRMCTCPPLARDRLIGLAGVSKSAVERMEKYNRLPVILKGATLDAQLAKIAAVIRDIADPDIFTWLDTGKQPTSQEAYRAATIVADRLCGAVANPIVRNAQETRQLELIGDWLSSRGYTHLPPGAGVKFNDMPPGTYAFRMNVPGILRDDSERTVNIPIDAAIAKKTAQSGDLPFLVEAKSAGDYTNVNKRRKEEATKVQQLRAMHGNGVEFILFLCGYFDSGYLGYEAAEGIDWVWEHRMDDLAEFGL